MKIEKITFVIPSRNNLEFLQLAYGSIRDLETKHEILVLDDASTDGTHEWIKDLNLSSHEATGQEEIILHRNPGPERIGIVGMFDKGIEMARTEIIFAFHSDMVAAPDLDKHVLKHLEKGTVVSATRVEPPLHPDGPEKMLVDFGIEVEDFDIDKFNNWVNNEYKPKHDKLVTEGIFAPWCMYKEDFLAVGGHDELFAPQSKEDSDLFNRFVLNGYKVLQTWEGLVYHFTSRGSRFNKHAGGAAGKNSEEWLYTTTKNMRNFIRKWGTVVKHDALMKPIIPHKYDIGFILKSNDFNLLHTLEPWCNTIYVNTGLLQDYIQTEQPNTSMNLYDRVKPLDNEKQNEILVTIDANKFTEQDFNHIQQLPEIIADSGEPAFHGELGNITVEIFDKMNTYEKNLIKC
jgi:GT2 family glycosyltransferase